MGSGFIAADPGVSVMAARIVRRLGLGTGPPPSSADKIAFSLSWYRFWPPYLGFILSLALVPNMVDWSRWDLPPVLSFLYYPLHFSRLFLKWGLRPDRKFLDD